MGHVYAIKVDNQPVEVTVSNAVDAVLSDSVTVDSIVNPVDVVGAVEVTEVSSPVTVSEITDPVTVDSVTNPVVVSEITNPVTIANTLNASIVGLDSSLLTVTLLNDNDLGDLQDEINAHLAGSSDKFQSITITALGSLLSGTYVACITEY